MPIRMVEDDPQNKNQSKRSSRSGSSSSGSGFSGLGGGVGNLVGTLLPFLIKKPKLLIVIIIVGIGLYFFMGRGCSADSLVNQSGGITQFFKGGELNKEVYEKTEIFEPLADNKKNPLPERVSLQRYCPTPMNQGQQGSCVAWASAFAARTIIEAQRTGKNPNSIKFSPSFMYNQISLDHNTCQGSYIKLAMDNMTEVGAVPFNSFRYTDKECTTDPGSTLKAQANAFKIKGFQRLTEDGQPKVAEVLAMKQNLAIGSPCIIGMMVGGSFMQNMMGKEFWNPTSSDYNQSGFGGHAMCVVGYDDFYEGGAFLLMNSWGTDWGKGGFAWVRYSDFKDFNKEAYGLYPMGDASKKAVSEFTGSFGLELNAGKKTINLRQVNGNYFETVGSLKTTDKFKVEFTNNVECYTYVFGEEVDGSSYTLFPYTKKHSPYCGITGTRLFPRDYSMVPDDKGSKDKIAVVITREPIDYDALNKKISSTAGASYEEKLSKLFGASGNVQYSGSQIVNFSTSNSNKNPIYFVIGISK